MKKETIKIPFRTTPSLIQMQADYLDAKKNEKGWKDHADGIKTNITLGLEAAGLEWPDKGKVLLEKLAITMSRRTSLNQPAIISLFQKYPAQAAAFFRVEYKLSVDREVIEAVCEAPGEFEEMLAECYSLSDPERRFSKK